MYLLIKAKINIKIKIINTINVIFLESSFIFNCNGVSILSISFSDNAILPISVFFPVLTTIPVLFPLVMLVPKNNIFFCSWRIKLFFKTSELFWTGTLSPVSADSSTFKLSHESILISAGIVSPDSKYIISPGTNSLVFITIILSSLLTLQVLVSYFFKSLNTKVAFSSCINPTIAFIKTTKSMTIVSVYSWE